MGSDSTCSIPTGCSVCFSACIRRPTSRAPGSACRSCIGSSGGTQGGFRCSYRIVAREAELRKALQERAPSFILSDFSLPGFDGMAALAIATKVAPDVPFIFLSGTIGEERAIEALHRGAVDYVLK